MSFIYSKTEEIIKKYNTRDPFELLDAIGAITKISYEYSATGLKGYCAIMNRTMYAVINGKLCDIDRRIAAGHEAAHLILHRHHIMNNALKAMYDFDLYNSNRRAEREANSFLADFIVPDEDVLDILTASRDYFAAASELLIPAPLFAFKLYSMMQRGYQVSNPIALDSGFLLN